MGWTSTFTEALHELNATADRILGHTRMLAGFQYHYPDWTADRARMAADNMREAAANLDKLAERLEAKEQKEAA